EKPLLEGLTGFQYYQGVLAVGRVPSPPPLEDLLRAMTRAPLLLAIDGLSNPENVGTIVRTAGALGVAGILAGPTTTSPYLRRAVRSSMGAVFGIPILEVETLEGSLASLAAHGIDCIAAHPHGAAHRLPELDLTRGCCLVLGSEGEGISPPVLAACHRTASIAMANGVDSLNVGAAAAAFLYEAARQRGRV
ncbi:MAG TPA: hypothetical protein DCM86_18605, partial [Verrucomicrobiales bacterium]|nr:hypothetical protein [Verrucomicrobiales bacterium]